MRNYIFVLLYSSVFISTSLFAQNSFDEGFIISNRSDTTFGYIQYKAFKNKDSVLAFKDTNKDATQEFTQYQIQAFGFKDGRYFKVLDLSSIEKLNEKFFAEVLIDGEVSLFKLSSGFVLLKNDQLTYLPLQVSDFRRSDVKLGERLKSELKRSNMLSAAAVLAGRCNSSLLQEYGFSTSEKSLTRLVKAYNECSGVRYVEYKNSLPWTSVGFSLATGLVSSRINFFDNDHYRFMDLAEFKSVMSLNVGAEIKITSPRLSQRTNFILGAYYQKTDYYGFYSDNRGTSSNSNSDIYINTTLLRMPVGFGFKVRPGNWLLNPSLGININQYLEVDYVRIEQRVYSNQNGITVISESYKNELRNELATNIGIWVGVGIHKNISKNLDIGMELRLENNAASFYSISSNLNNFQLIFSLNYNK